MGYVRFWDDRKENIVDPYFVSVTGTETTAVGGEGVKVPALLYTVTIFNSGASEARLELHDSSSTADSNQVWEGGVDASGTLHAEFPRGVYFDAGIVIVATGAAGSVSLTRHELEPNN